MDITPFILNIRDKNALLAAYMPFIKNGGMFFKATQLPMGTSVGVILEIPGEPTRYGIDAKVVYIAPASVNGGGVGIQFKESLPNAQMVTKIEKLLAGLDRSKLPTFTL